MKVVLATGNKGKVSEFNQLLFNTGIHVVPQSDFQIRSVEETGTTFVENAIIKARHASEITGLPAMADDSGLEVDALHGAPGIISARYSGEEGNDHQNVAKVLQELSAFPEELRTARFQCVIVFMRHAKDASPIICEGTWEGRLLNVPVGENGFGYDPIFYSPELNCSAAQLSSEIKNKISHRGKCLQKLLLEIKKIHSSM